MYKRFKRWMRFDPPAAATVDEWNDFHARFQKEAPIRHWIYEASITVRVKVKRAMRIFDEVRYRVVRYHVINTGLEPGYYDKSSLMLYGNFALLVDYVEIELASQQDVQKDINGRVTGKNWWRKLRHHLPFWTTYSELTFRSKEMGLLHLEWECSLDSEDLDPNLRSPAQAKVARQVRDLYIWWTETRPNRKEPELPEEVAKYMEDKSIFYGGSAQFHKDHPEYAMKYQDWSQDYQSFNAYCEIEDDDMLLQLIKLRKSLWT